MDMSPGRLGEREGIGRFAGPMRGRGPGRQGCERLGWTACTFTHPAPLSLSLGALIEEIRGKREWTGCLVGHA